MPAPNSAVACPSCGKSNPEGNRFCFACGRSLASVPQQATAASSSPQQGRTCASCGAAIAPGNKFCLSCGTPVTSAAAVPVQKSTETAATPQTATKTAAVAATPAFQPMLPITPAVPEPSQPPAKLEAPAPAPAPPVVRPADPKPAPEVQLAPIAQPSKAAEQVCASCGAAISPGNKFCLSCGKPVAATAAIQTPAVTAALTQTAAAVTVPAAQPTVPKPPVVPQPSTASTRIESPAPPPPTRPAPAPIRPTPIAEDQPGPFQQAPHSGSKAWIIVIVLLAVMGGTGWYVWKYFSRPDVTVMAIPPRIHVAVGGQTLLEAGVSGSNDTDVTWSIQEGTKGGQIKALGAQADGGQAHAAATYTAPQTAGTFHVIAASHANPNRSATFEIVVGGASQPDTSGSGAASAAPTPAPPSAAATNPNAQQIVGVWRGPSGEKIVIGADSTLVVTSDTDPANNKQGTYRFTDNSHMQIDFGNGDTRTWQILGADSSYLRILAQSKTDASPTAIVLARLPN